MNLNKEQLKMISSYFEEEGLNDQLLIDDLSDHLSCKIETYMDSEGLPFSEAYEMAKKECFPNGPKEFEKDLKLLTTQKPTIMIRKIAFIGGYASVLCFCLAILLFSLSSFKNKKLSLMFSSAQMEWNLSRSTGNMISVDSFQNSQNYIDYKDATIKANISSYKQYSLGETMLILSFILFVSTFLPYKFYSGYQKHDLAIQT